MKKIVEQWLQNNLFFRYLIITVLVLGLFFRFANLGDKIYWIDETFTSLRISGYTELELVKEVSGKEIIGIKTLQKYQRINSNKTVLDTINGVAKEEPQLTPLYFIIARFWAEFFGSSVLAIRSLSAVISLLAFPALYWLCQELFEFPFVSWVSIALMAVSPIHVLYAQEARPYSLWSVTIIFSCAAFLHTIRRKSALSFFYYFLSLILGFYTHLFFAFVVLFHIIYLTMKKKFKWTPTLAGFTLVWCAGVLSLIPWFLAVISNWEQVQNKTNWQTQRIVDYYNALFKIWLVNVNLPFLDFNFASSRDFRSDFIGIGVLVVGFCFISYALYFTYRHSSRRIWKFILLLSSLTFILLAVPDLLFGGMRSTVSRYMIPCYVGLQLATAYFLADRIIFSQKKIWWNVVLGLVLSLGIISCLTSFQSSMWWVKYNSNNNYDIAKIINETKAPLIITETESNLLNFKQLGNLLSLSYILDEKVKLNLINSQSFNNPKSSITYKVFSDIFLYNPSDELLSLLQNQKCQTQKVFINIKDEMNLYKIN